MNTATFPDEALTTESFFQLRMRPKELRLVLGKFLLGEDLVERLFPGIYLNDYFVVED